MDINQLTSKRCAMRSEMILVSRADVSARSMLIVVVKCKKYVKKKKPELGTGDDLSQLLAFVARVHNSSGLLEVDHFAVDVDDHFEAHHTHIRPAFFRDPGLQELSELLIEIL